MENDMNRSDYYDDDCNGNWQRIRWRGMVASATRGRRGRRGQSLLIAMRDALDAMTEKRLIANELESRDGARLGAAPGRRTLVFARGAATGRM